MIGSMFSDMLGSDSQITDNMWTVLSCSVGCAAQMTYVQATQGGGGWPMNVFLTPDLQPFIGGTYWPPQDAYGRPGEPR